MFMCDTLVMHLMAEIEFQPMCSMQEVYIEVSAKKSES
jgi:hypothetical protein